MSKRPEQTFLQRHKDGQQVHEKMFNITNYQKNANQNYNEELLMANEVPEWPSLISLQITNAGEGVEKREPSYTCTIPQYGGSSETESRTTI